MLSLPSMSIVVTELVASVTWCADVEVNIALLLCVCCTSVVLLNVTVVKKNGHKDRAEVPIYDP